MLSRAACLAQLSSTSPEALLMGWSMTTNGKPSAPSTRAINSAALTNFVVMMPTEGLPIFSPITASCKLHDEQLPQSPIPATTASQFFASSTIYLSAGAL
jgi:hypothetical protein